LAASTAGRSRPPNLFPHSDHQALWQGLTPDHAWGAHHLVLGGAVRGGDIYGSYPALPLKGPEDSGSIGSWLRTIAVEEVGATPDPGFTG